jgi:hypothetical protein
MHTTLLNNDIMLNTTVQFSIIACLAKKVNLVVISEIEY